MDWLEKAGAEWRSVRDAYEQAQVKRIKDIEKALSEGVSGYVIARAFGVSHQRIFQIKRRKGDNR